MNVLHQLTEAEDELKQVAKKKKRIEIKGVYSRQ
jgi:hypothetical protein